MSFRILRSTIYVLYDSLFAVSTSGLCDILSAVSFIGRSSPRPTIVTARAIVVTGLDRFMSVGTMGAGVWGAEEGYKPRTSRDGSSSSVPEELVRRVFGP